MVKPGLRLFLTCWLVFVVHFASNTVREIYLALAIGDHLSFRVDEYAGMHPDLFEKPGYGWHIGANPGASMLAAIPYAAARPVIDRAVARANRNRSNSEPPAYNSPWPMAREFYREAWRRGYDVKFGLAALGFAREQDLVLKGGARDGDRLYLTKPIGTGLISTALKNGWMTETDMAPAIGAMTTLNASAAAAIAEVGDAVHAATDVTGFGLLGHLHNVLAASGVGARLDAGRVPLFDRVHELIAKGAVPGGTKRNLEAAARFTAFGPGLTDVDRTWLSDAQTSGGLLIAVEAERAEGLLDALRRHATPAAARIGEVTRSVGRVEVTAGG